MTNLGSQKELRVKLSESKIQATRTREAIEVQSWLLFLPNGDSVCCKTIESARELAAKYSCTIYL